MQKLIHKPTALFVAGIFLAGVFSAEAKQPKETRNIVEVAVDLNSDTNGLYFGQFDILIGAVLAADPAIVATLTANGKRTVFAPVDAAFEALGITEDNVAGIDQDYLTEVLAYHVVNGNRKSKSVIKAKTLKTLQKGILLQSEGVLTDGLGRDSEIIVTDVVAANGVIHAVNSVLLPFEAPTLVDLAIELNSNSNSPYFGQFDVLIGAVLAADPVIVATLSAKGQRTVFAPIDAAFEALGITAENVGDLDAGDLTEVLSHHVVNGRRDSRSVLKSKSLRTLQGGFLKQDSGVLTDAYNREANIIVTDLPAKNGIIHAIDNVVLPYESSNIVDLAIELNSNSNSPYFGQFDILIGAVLAADPVVLETLTGKKSLTVFAPIDSAFEAVGITEANVDSQDADFLTEVLGYHVLNGRRTSNSVLKAKQLKTLQGEFLLQSGGVLTDVQDRDANIIVTDLPAANGIVHAIDAVVLPFLP